MLKVRPTRAVMCSIAAVAFACMQFCKLYARWPFSAAQLTDHSPKVKLVVHSCMPKCCHECMHPNAEAVQHPQVPLTSAINAKSEAIGHDHRCTQNGSLHLRQQAFAYGKSLFQKHGLLSSPDLPTSEGQGYFFCLQACLTSGCLLPTGPALPVPQSLWLTLM